MSNFFITIEDTSYSLQKPQEATKVHKKILTNHQNYNNNKNNNNIEGNLHNDNRLFFSSLGIIRPQLNKGAMKNPVLHEPFEKKQLRFNNNELKSKIILNNNNNIDFYLQDDESKESFVSDNFLTIQNNRRPLTKNKKSFINKKKKLIQLETNEEDFIESEEILKSYKNYGILLIFLTIIYLVFGMLTIFNIGNDLYLKLIPQKILFFYENNDFPIENYYGYVILLSPTVFWIWCIVSWVGMKLFRHAKGIANV